MRALLVAVGLALLQSGGPAIRVLPEAPRGMAMEERNGDNIPYDGRFVFARIRYQVSGFGFRGDPQHRPLAVQVHRQPVTIPRQRERLSDPQSAPPQPAQ